MSRDSPRNCLANCPRWAPSDLRTPTSRIRCEALAVDRFMKLKQAISRMNNAVMLNMYTLFMLPGGDISNCRVECR